MHPAVLPLVDAGLGNTSYLVDLGDGRALVVDAPRDTRALRREAARVGLEVAYAADTHLHADFVTAAVDLAADGAQLLASAAGGREYPHRGLRDGDEVDLGGLTVRALSTPGHTDEHLALVLLDGTRPVGVFTGGSLLVGSAARTDLVDPARTRELARAQWRSLQRLLALPDEVEVWPTHGAGSFCAAPAGTERTSTIGREKRANELLRAGGEDEFADLLLAGLGDFPPYFTRLPELNRRGPRRVGIPPVLAQLAPSTVALAVETGTQVVDVRPVQAYAAAHVPRSLSIPLREAFATWLGWTARPELPLVVVRDAEQDPEEVAWNAVKIGFDDLAGELAGGVPAWERAGLPVSRTRLVPTSAPGGLVGLDVVDVRQRAEFLGGHVPGARNVELSRLAAGDVAGLPDQPAVMCGHGERAMTAASLLERVGVPGVSVVAGGPGDWTGHASPASSHGR